MWAHEAGVRWRAARPNEKELSSVDFPPAGELVSELGNLAAKR